MLIKAVQQGRSERSGEAYAADVELLSEATCLREALRRRQGMLLADFFSILLRGVTSTMPLDARLGKTMLQLITSRYDDRHWRKKIEKTLGLPQSGVSDPVQQQIFMYLKIELKAYKSRRADPDSWIIGGYATKEIIERAKFQPQLVGPGITKDDVAFLGSDPGKDIDEAWWDEMLVSWFDVPEEEKPMEDESSPATDPVSSPAIKSTT